MFPLIIRIFSNSIALGIAHWLVPGFVVNGGLKEFLIAGLLLGLLNLFVKPILKLISTPIIILTLGIFSLIINGFLLWLVSYLVPFVSIQTAAALIWATIIVTFANIILTSISKALKAGDKD
ncbi:MAG: phage holin family protein [Candidatus Taylorbacteria bacterium]|nr:phage holin family protein [Candidatus Taylorbacteria bacterium]